MIDSGTGRQPVLRLAADEALVRRLNDLLGIPLFKAVPVGENTAPVLEVRAGDGDKELLRAALCVALTELQEQRVFAGQLQRSLVAVRKELFETSRSLADIEDYAAKVPVLPFSEPSPDVRVGKTRLSTGEEFVSRTRARTRGMCGLVVTVNVLAPAIVDFIAEGRESGHLLGAWSVRLPPGEHDIRLSMGRGMRVDDAEAQITVRVIEGKVELEHVVGHSESSPSQPTTNLRARVYRWPAGLRVPTGWGLETTPEPVESVGLVHSDDDVVPWNKGDLRFWVVPRYRRRRPFSEHSLVDPTQSFVSSRGDFVQVHPIPGELVLAVAPIVSGWPHAVDVRAFLAHENAPAVQLWVGVCGPDQIGERGPSPELVTQIIDSMATLANPFDPVAFRLPAESGQCVVMASAVPRGRTNEWAWLRFGAPVRAIVEV